MPEYSLEEKTLMAEIMRESDWTFVDIFVGYTRVQSGRKDPLGRDHERVRLNVCGYICRICQSTVWKRNPHGGDHERVRLNVCGYIYMTCQSTVWKRNPHGRDHGRVRLNVCGYICRICQSTVWKGKHPWRRSWESPTKCLWIYL